MMNRETDAVVADVNDNGGGETLYKCSKSLADELRSVASDVHETYTLSFDEHAKNYTYSLKSGTHPIPESNHAKTEDCVSLSNKYNATEDEISPPTSCEESAAGDGNGASLAREETQGIETLETLGGLPTQDSPVTDKGEYIPHSLSIIPEQNKETSDSSQDQQDFITAPDSVAEQGGSTIETSLSMLSSQKNDLSVEYSYESVSQRSASRTVQVSRCKTPEVPKHMAKMMGCKALLLPKPQSHTARIQTHSKRLKEIYTQSLYTETNETAMQARADVNMANIQTSPMIFQTNVGTVFPERKHIYTRTHKQLTKPEKAQQKKRQWNSSSKVDNNTADKKVYQGIKCCPEIAVGKLDFQRQAKSRIGSITDHKPTGGNKKIQTQKLDFREKATAKVGSLDNALHQPSGGDQQVFRQKLSFREKANSKVGSMTNIHHKAGGGDKLVLYQVVARRRKPFESYLKSNSCNFLSGTPKIKPRERSVSSDRTESRTCSVMMTEPVRRHTPHTQQTHQPQSRISQINNEDITTAETSKSACF